MKTSKDIERAPEPRGEAAIDPSVRLARGVGRESLAVRTRLLAGVISRLYDEQLRPVGLTANQFEALALIVAAGRTSMRELAGQLHLDGPTMGRTIESMIDSRWLASEGDAASGMTVITSTRRGRRLFEEALPAWKRAQHAAADLLGSQGTRVMTSHGVYTALW